MIAALANNTDFFILFIELKLLSRHIYQLPAFTVVVLDQACGKFLSINWIRPLCLEFRVTIDNLECIFLDDLDCLIRIDIRKSHVRTIPQQFFIQSL